MDVASSSSEGAIYGFSSAVFNGFFGNGAKNKGAKTKAKGLEKNENKR